MATLVAAADNCHSDKGLRGIRPRKYVVGHGNPWIFADNFNHCLCCMNSGRGKEAHGSWVTANSHRTSISARGQDLYLSRTASNVFETGVWSPLTLYTQMIMRELGMCWGYTLWTFPFPGAWWPYNDGFPLELSASPLRPSNLCIYNWMHFVAWQSVPRSSWSCPDQAAFHFSCLSLIPDFSLSHLLWCCFDTLL